MKRYHITVNGTTYDVAVEEADGASAPLPVAAPVAPIPAAPAAKPSGVQGGIKIEAPMPGTIVDVKVKVGDNVQNGTVIAVLEAMKMENDIVAAEAGVITSVDVAKGASVETGTVVATMSS